MKKQFFRICSTVLIIVLLVNMLPMSIFAEEFRESITTEIKQPDTSLEMTTQSDAKIIGEIPSKRTQYSKEFMLSNGLHLAAVYPDAVHYEADGSWEEIDNTLILKNGKYINTAGVWNVSFPQQLSDSKSVTIEKDGYTLSFAMVGELRSTGLEIAGAIGEEDVASVKESVMQVLENPVQELSMETEATAPTMETAALETVPEEIDPQGTIVETVPETTVTAEATEPEEVETEQIVTGTVPEKLAVSQMQLSTAAVQALDKAGLHESYQYAEMAPEKLYSRLAYTDVYQNTDIIYDMDSNRVKESIVMEAYSSTLRGYRYTLNVGQMIPVLEADGQITLYDANKEKVIMVMPAPYLADAAEEYNRDVQVQLTGKGSTYTLTYLLPTQWLAAAERAWPVILDPVVTASLSISNIKDDTVSETNEYGYENDFLEAGHSNSRGVSRIYLMYQNLPQLTSSDVIVAATVQLQKKVDGETVSLEVHKVNSTWTSSTINWSNKPAYNQNIEDYAMVGAAGRYTWIITDVVRDWYANKNTGMMFKVSDAEEAARDNRYKQFYSSDQSTTSRRPTLAIIFRNNNGLESYWDYTSVSAGRAGAGYVNNFTGNMTWIHNDIGFDGNRMPVSINHVYNLNDAYTASDSNNSNDTAGNSFGMGIGWRTNYNQLVYKWSVDSDYYVWEDADGTDHYFQYDSTAGKYKDEDGLELTLTDTGSGTTKYCLADKNGNCSYFDTYGRLSKISNNQQTKSSINITYYSTTRLITCITDGIGRRYLYMYTNGLLNRIDYMGSGSTVLSHVDFAYKNEYDTNRLSTITYKDGKQCTYTYSVRGLLWSATDVDGYKINYTYNSGMEYWQPYRVLRIAEQDTVNSADGGTLNFSYGHNQTTVTDHDGNTEIYQFNDWGNTVSIQDDEGHASFAKYARTKRDDTAGKANQLKISSKLQNTVGNMIYNNSFESGISPWNLNTTGGTLSQTTETAYIGNACLKAEYTAPTRSIYALGPTYQALPGKTYTLSMYIKTVGIKVTYGMTNTGTWGSTSGGSLDVDQDWTRVQMTYTNTGTETINFRPFVAGTTIGTYYVDGVQVEEAVTASRYNLVENGDFRRSASWTISANCTSADTYTTVSGETHPAKELQNTYFKITGDPAKYKNIKQDVVVSGSAGDSFVLAGWAKGRSAPLSGDRKFAIRARFNYTDGTTSEYFDAQFNTAVDQWQYSAVAMVAKQAYSSIMVAAVYDYNVNTAYFDGIQLFKEEFGSSYTYDDKGNVTKVVDLQKQATSYEYNTAGDLTKILQDNKAKVTYTYDSYHNVETATTNKGVVYTFEYDKYGNNTKVSIGSGSQKISSSAAYSADGNLLVSTTDALAKVTTYGYNEDTGVLDWVRYPEDTEATRTNYTYDTMYRMAKAECTTDSGLNQQAVYNYDENGRLFTISSPTTFYMIGYRAFGQRGAVTVGGLYFLATYEYTQDANRYLQQLTYGNNHFVNYTYDNKGRLLTQTYEDGDTVSYTYDNNGALATVKDSATGRTTTYYYDLTDRMMKYTEKGTNYSHSVGYAYDTKNNLTQQVEEINGTRHTTSYTYDDDNRIISVTTDGITLNYTYDNYGRLYQKSTATSTFSKTETFTYTETDASFTSAQVATHTIVITYIYSSSTYSLTNAYTYDNNGNITSVSDGTNTVTYQYDSANQLIRENNQAGGFTHTWTYDNAGNILNRKEYAYTTESLDGVTPTKTATYGYENAFWGDLLTSYDGKTIVQDNIGNPLSYGEWTYTWEHGRQLASMSDGTTAWSFTYNADGLRTAKTDGTDTWNYVYNGSQLTQFTNGTDTLYFTYDASGTPTTVRHNGTLYYYVTNIQGDVVAIANRFGTLVANYSYNAWGVCTVTGLDLPLAELNPLRYRGYVYDQETGLYYLQSRYYDPAIGRFLNADGQISGVGGDIRGYNQFAYCFNNPVNLTDSTGNWPKFLKEIGSRIAHGVKIITRIVTSPLKASTLEIGGGVGYGASAKASVLEIPVEVSAYATVTDSYVYDKGSHDVRNTSASKIGVNVGNVVDLTSSKGKSHSYLNEECECSFWNSTFGEKSNCVANKKYTSSEATLGISAGLYIGIGFEFSFGFDFKTWGNELISIYHDSLSYEGYY